MVNKYAIGILVLVLLTASIYILVPENVRIDVGKTYSTFKVWEDGSWVLAGREYSLMFDGTTKMRASSRTVESFVEGNIITIIRTANFKNNVTVIDTYTFDGDEKDIKLFPISHEINVLNGEGYILVYEVTKLDYSGETIKDILSPQTFGHNMRIEWEDGNYYSRIWGYANRDEGKLTVKYRPDSNDFTKQVRLFDPPAGEGDIGYEFLDDNKVVHIWNTQNDYFFEKDAGIQLTNHFEDYWTRNIFCLGYYSGEEWIKIKCADELTNFNKNIESDDETYVNATLWKDISYGAYDLRLGVQYHLGLDDKSLSITIYGKNIGIDIPFDLGFAWKITDVEIATEEEDYISLNGTEYHLNETFNLLFKNMTKSDFDEEANETVIEAIPKLRIHDRLDFLKIDWNKNLNYAVKMYGNGNQEDFYVALLINAGHFNPQQEKSTTFSWIDAPFDPVPVGTKRDTSGANSLDGVKGVFVLDNYAYTVSWSDDTLSVWDISGHGNPVPVGSYADSEGNYSLNLAWGIFVSGNYAYTAADDTLAVWDISGHGNPVPVGTYSAPTLKTAIAVFVSGDYAYVVSNSNDTLTVFNISSHGDPVPVGSYTASSGDYSLEEVYDVFVSGDYAYTVSSADDNLVVWNISEHGDPIPVGRVTDTSGGNSLDGVKSVFVSGDYAYTVCSVDDTLSVWDISGHGNPSRVGSYTASSGDYSLDSPRGGWVSGDYVYTVSNSDDTLVVWNISEHDDPVPIGSYGPDDEGDYSLDGAYDVFVLDGYAYTVSFTDDTLAVFNISEQIEVDTTPPYFTNGTPTNQTIEEGTALNYDINASDETEFDCFAVNDTTNFKINCDGLLQNNTVLGAALYNLNITINDTSNNLNSTLMWVNVTVVPPVDTCTCPGAGNNWEVDMEDCCNLTTACTLTTGNLSWIGSSGYFNCSANLNLTNRDAPPSATTFYWSDGCEVIRLIILVFISTALFKKRGLKINGKQWS